MLEIDQRLKRLGLEPSSHWELQRKTLAWRLGPRPDNMSQNDPKTTSLMMSVTKNQHPPTKKFFFKCNLQD